MIPSIKLRCTVLALSLVLSAGCISTALILPLMLPQSKSVSTEDEISVPVYILRAQDGEICVYENDQLVLHTGVAVASLPTSDQTLLDGGIAASSPAELTQLLEDLTS